ncbi:MAG: hypothetical protein KC502_16135 [Myxococcales bacterium]|nr:hypothetical protein [Myxococcales bacterium]
MSQLKAKANNPPEQVSAVPNTVKPKGGRDLRGMVLAQQQAAVSPSSSGGMDAQQAALRPSPAPGDLIRQQEQLASIASAAAKEATLESAADDSQSEEKQATTQSKHPMLKRVGDKIGLGLGILVTRVLKYVPGWNDPVKDENGKDKHHIHGADRIGDHKLRKRHVELVGPIIVDYVKTLGTGRIREFLQGVGDGASRAPGETYRREVAAAEEKKAKEAEGKSGWWPW